MLELRVLDLFFHWNKCFCYYTKSKVPKKGTVGYRYRISGTDTCTGTGSNVNGTQLYFRTRLYLQIRSLLIERWWVHVTCEIISCALPYKTNGMYFHNELSVSFMVVQKLCKRQDGNTGGQFFLSLDLVQWTVSLLHTRDSERFLLLVTSTKEQAG